MPRRDFHRQSLVAIVTRDRSRDRRDDSLHRPFVRRRRGDEYKFAIQIERAAIDWVARLLYHRLATRRSLPADRSPRTRIDIRVDRDAFAGKHS